MKYPVILLDPPWPYERTHGQGIAEQQYDLMTWDDIAALGGYVAEVAAPNCAIFCWTTAPLLMETVAAVQQWPFRYITKAFTWVKIYADNGLVVGTGSHIRSNTEDVWLLSNGTPKRKSANVGQVVNNVMTARLQDHSRKPNEIHRRIEQAYEGPYLELFARRPRAGWTCLGNEIDGLDIRVALRNVAQAEDVPTQTTRTQPQMALWEQEAA